MARRGSLCGIRHHHCSDEPGLGRPTLYSIGTDSRTGYCGPFQTGDNNLPIARQGAVRWHRTRRTPGPLVSGPAGSFTQDPLSARDQLHYRSPLAGPGAPGFLGSSGGLAACGRPMAPYRTFSAGHVVCAFVLLSCAANLLDLGLCRRREKHAHGKPYWATCLARHSHCGILSRVAGSCA